LRPDIQLNERVQICELLNKLSDYRWIIRRSNDFGEVVVDLNSLKEVDIEQSQFEKLSKVLDGMELNCLVRQETGRIDTKRAGK